MNLVESALVTSPIDLTEECAQFTIDDITQKFILSAITTVGTEYTLSFWIRSEAAGSVRTCWTSCSTSTTWTKYTITFTAHSENVLLRFETPGTYHIYHTQLNMGNKASDWSEAAEDLADAANNAQQTADGAQQAVNSAIERLTIAESLIAKLDDAIHMLITDSNGGSLMTQTSTGWTFNMDSVNDTLSEVSGLLNDLQQELGDTDATVNNLKNAVDDLNELSSYVQIKTDGDQPCIELGTGKSDFKVLITNTDIRFMEGSNVVAHISNQSLHIKKAVIEEELQQGDFVWKKRANGNMGLQWKGVTS